MFTNIFSINSPASIKRQVNSLVILGLFIMVFIIILSSTYIVKIQSSKLMLGSAYQITEGLAKQSVYSLLSGSADNANDIIDQVLGFNEVLGARITDTEGNIFIAEGEKISYKQKIGAYTGHTIILENEGFWLIQAPIVLEQSSNELDDFQLHTVELDIKTEVIGYVELIYSKENLIESQKTVVLATIIIGLISVFCLTLLMNKRLNLIFSPLAKLASTMYDVEKQGKYITAEVNGAREIRRMAQAYNRLMVVLDAQDEILRQHSDMLEKEINIRTQELVLARDSALTANRHKSEFLANMSHELRTPIQAIMGYCELVNEELEIEGHFELMEDMDKILRNSQRLLVLINSLLDLAKIEAGKMEVNYSKLKINDLLQTLSDTITPIASKNNNLFIINNQCNVELLNTDKTKLEQALLNLLSNACKFTEKGKIELNVECDNNNVTFIIHDTGIGIAENKLSSIFEEFTQVDASDSRQYSGTGLGLAITKRFIEMLNGHISVTSELNKGSTFVVTIKRASLFPQKPQVLDIIY